MQYAVFSDSHDNFYNLEQAIKIIKDRSVATCFHLGDFCAPGFVRAMVAHGEIKWICVWGNVDGAKAKILLEQRGRLNFDIVDESFREVTLPEGKVFLTHFPLLAQIAIKSGEYRAVFYGDDHTKKVEKFKDGTLLANPGELSGFKSGQPSFGIWDSRTNEIEIINLTDFKVAK